MKRLVYLLIFPIFLALVFSSGCCGPKIGAAKLPIPPAAPVVETPPPPPAPAPAPPPPPEPKEEKG